MAEVLITLGIIGVVVALIMPVLIQNHRKHVVETSLRKFYSAVNQAVQMSELTNGSSQNWEGCIGMAEYMSCQEWYNKYLKNYLKTVKEEIVTVKNLSANSKVLAVYFTDSTLMLILPSNYPEVYFFPNAKDFNSETFLSLSDAGNSLPDSGRKFFVFEFSSAKYNGELVVKADCNDEMCLMKPMRGSKQKRFYPFLYCFNQNDENRNQIANCPSTQEELMGNSFGSQFGCNKEAKMKDHCAALIQMNGWKIPENYPFKF